MTQSRESEQSIIEAFSLPQFYVETFGIKNALKNTLHHSSIGEDI